MGTDPGGNGAATIHATELAHFDVTLADGAHHIVHGLAAVERALSDGCQYAIEAEAANWYSAVAAEYRPEAEAAKVVDLNAAIQAVLDAS